MRHSSFPSGGRTPRFHRRRRAGRLSAAAALAAILSLASLGELPSSDGVAPIILADKGAAKAPGDAVPALPASYASLFDPMPMSRTSQFNFRSAGTAPASRLAVGPATTPLIVAAARIVLPPERPSRVAVAPPMQLAEAAPLPVPRPVERQVAKSPEPARPLVPTRLAEAPPAAEPQEAAPVQSPRAAARHLSHRRSRVAAVQAPPEDNRSFIEKLFGLPQTSGPSYAALNTGADVTPRRSFNTSPTPGVEVGTAVYDISAATVYLPNGDKLEAHSGLGDRLDDPRSAPVRMRGVTPPGTYELTEREALFHGVRALRLNPVGGSGTIFGRAGLLAHTFMLGPNGDSNGCVSFRDYQRFLQAYLRGEVRRLVVVAGRGDGVPFMKNRRFGMPFPTRDGSA